MNAPTKPSLWQYIGYCYGGRLPDSMRDWVRDDLAGKGATVRMMIRVFIPAFLIMAAAAVTFTTILWFRETYRAAFVGSSAAATAYA